MKKNITMISDCLTTRTHFRNYFQKEFTVTSLSSKKIEDAEVSGDNHMDAFVIHDVQGSEKTTLLLHTIRQSHPNTFIYVLSQLMDNECVRTFIYEGADGFFTLDQSFSVFSRLKECIHQGYAYLDEHSLPFIWNECLQLIHGPKNPEWKREPLPLKNELFSKRETIILYLICNGLTNDEVAQTLFLSKHTVYTHVRNVIKKLNVPDRTAAIVMAIKNEWITLYSNKEELEQSVILHEQADVKMQP
ncbi:helix-turn-helix transcriptional regulator [Desertibacillus haloalkaliphilus]|uniref:helix-turn-helix transcriptional regulator n=1 Tax=Desertibacillus haloalkaliphilus TaxID=1328930 RepID=UPI001C26A4CD|nr:response regulator transcription factor [Desertibacillus haloalkaliphilus]MBU8908141.1 response regulator transcription factor [Desertibacillus haloalkaliphilus]